jgi:Flp pilus assembly protein TadG
MMRSFIDKYCRYLLSWPRGFSSDRSGVVVVLVALAMPVLAGTMGLAAEVSYWYQHKRGMQNAADAAAIAAATGANASTTYAAQAKAVAAQLGFTNGSGNITVTATSTNNATGCPANTNCYTVTISDKVPLFLSRVIGYAGTGNTGLTAISASSVAASAKAYPYCILALAGDVATDLTTNGAPKTNLNGCNTMANSSSTCNGHNLNAGIGDAHGTNNGCGIIQNSNVPTVSDPYSNLASNIPADSCGGKYPQEPGKKGPALPVSNQWGGSYSLSGNKIVCGDQQLTADTTISGNGVLVIENGQLDLNGYTLQSAAGSGLTVVFTSPPADYGNQTYLHYPTNSGTLDIAAPTSGTWSGMALYQDPNLTEPAGGGNLDVTYKGNQPTWDISGMVYLPNSSVTMSGAVNKGTNGLNCFGMAVDNLLINGTGSIFANDTQCKAAGLALPQGGNRGTLVN